MYINKYNRFEKKFLQLQETGKNIYNTVEALKNLQGDKIAHCKNG